MTKDEKLRKALDKRGYYNEDLYNEILDLFGVSTRTYPIYEIGTTVNWGGKKYWVVEDDNKHQVLVSNCEDFNDPNYNDWWVDKMYVC